MKYSVVHFTTLSFHFVSERNGRTCLNDFFNVYALFLLQMNRLNVYEIKYNWCIIERYVPFTCVNNRKSRKKRTL